MCAGDPLHEDVCPDVSAKNGRCLFSVFSDVLPGGIYISPSSHTVQSVKIFMTSSGRAGLNVLDKKGNKELAVQLLLNSCRGAIQGQPCMKHKSSKGGLTTGI